MNPLPPLVYLLPEGNPQPIADAQYAYNALRYFFCQTQAHPTTVLTALNYYLNVSYG